jgi:hypothetical protein
MSERTDFHTASIRPLLANSWPSCMFFSVYSSFILRFSQFSDGFPFALWQVSSLAFMSGEREDRL